MERLASTLYLAREKTEQIRAQTVQAALEELNALFAKESQSKVAPWTLSKARRLIARAKDEVGGKDAPSFRVFQLYESVSDTLYALSRLAQEKETGLSPAAKDLLAELKVQVLPVLAQDLFTPAVHMHHASRLCPLEFGVPDKVPEPSPRQRFLLAVDASLRWTNGRSLAWPLARPPTNHELALLALVADDFPDSARTTFTTPKQVIRRMSIILNSERKRLVLLLQRPKTLPSPPPRPRATASPSPQPPAPPAKTMASAASSTKPKRAPSPPTPTKAPKASTRSRTGAGDRP